MFQSPPTCQIIASNPAFLSPFGAGVELSRSTAGRQHVFGSTSGLGGALGATHTTKAFVPIAWLVAQSGTEQYPWIVQVDSQRPEANRDFDIQFVQHMDQDEIYSRNGFHIRRTVAPQDHEKWEATIPNGYDPQYAGRLILVKGPLQDYWQRSAETYHSTNKIKCPATKMAHSASEIAISGTTDRLWAYYLLCFGPEIALDNQIFSKDEYLVPMGKNPMVSAAKENAFQKDLRSLVLYWHIAVRGGTKISNGKKSDHSKDLFD
jgi:hypothetical protein